MNRRYRSLMLILGIILFLNSLRFFNLTLSNEVVFWIAVLSAVIMDLSLLYIGELKVEFTETITVFIYLFFGVYVAIVFEFIYTLLGSVLSYFIIKRKFEFSRHLLNASMFSLITFLSGNFVNYIRMNIRVPYITTLIISALLFDFVFLVLNIIFITIDKTLEDKEFFSIKNFDLDIILINLIVSTLLSVILYVIYGAIGLSGLILVFGVLIITHYVFYLYNKLNFKAVLIT